MSDIIKTNAGSRHGYITPGSRETIVDKMPCHVRAYIKYYTFNSSWVEIFSEPCSNPKTRCHHSYESRALDNQHMVFQQCSQLQGFKIILYTVTYMYYGHDINVWPKHPHIYELMGEFIILSPPILESLTTSNLTDFSVYIHYTL